MNSDRVSLGALKNQVRRNAAAQKVLVLIYGASQLHRWCRNRPRHGFHAVQAANPISLEDKTVFVTGGSRGLGLLLAQEFASRGAKIAISARDRSELERAETQLRRITPDVLTLKPI
jgi:NADPH:quinone reductase-like Zn-dependent oxidoreductase